MGMPRFKLGRPSQERLAHRRRPLSKPALPLFTSETSDVTASYRVCGERDSNANVKPLIIPLHITLKLKTLIVYKFYCKIFLKYDYTHIVHVNCSKKLTNFVFNKDVVLNDYHFEFF